MDVKFELADKRSGVVRRLCDMIETMPNTHVYFYTERNIWRNGHFRHCLRFSRDGSWRTSNGNSQKDCVKKLIKAVWGMERRQDA